MRKWTLDLWFSPTDYYTFLATNKGLDDPSLRAKYLKSPTGMSQFLFSLTLLAWPWLSSAKMAIAFSRREALSGHSSEYLLCWQLL